MAFPQGIDFRSSSGFVTDPANYDYEISTGGNYPRTSVQGNTVGYELPTGGNEQTRDRNAGNDPRIAGFAYSSNLSTVTLYRIDLPSAGDYNVGFASGDPSYALAASTYDLYDGPLFLVNLCTGGTSAAQRFKDATNTEYTNVTWPTSQTLVSKTFASTICRFRSTEDGVNGQVICSCYVESASTAPAVSVNFRPNKLRPAIFKPGIAR